MQGNSKMTHTTQNFLRHAQKRRAKQHYNKAADSFITATYTPVDGQLGQNM
jgi:hypothetical protein